MPDDEDIERNDIALKEMASRRLLLENGKTEDHDTKEDVSKEIDEEELKMLAAQVVLPKFPPASVPMMTVFDDYPTLRGKDEL